MPSTSKRTTKNMSKRTSTEAAALALLRETPKNMEVLEATGELPTPFSLPPPSEPVTARNVRIPKNPIAAAASNTALGAKWGIPDYERLAETGGSRRVTRTYAQAARDTSKDSARQQSSQIRTKGDKQSARGGVMSTTTQTDLMSTNRDHKEEKRPLGSSLEEATRPDLGC
ncbi:hypothetical protein OH77DRAFT_1382936, partial [Trametes cingulata]